MASESLSGAGRRRKGVKGEHEVKERLTEQGFAVRGLEGEGDHIAVKQTSKGGLLALHVETKRQERLRIPEWVAQAEADASPGFMPLLCYRRSNEKWYAVIALDDFLECVK